MYLLFSIIFLPVYVKHQKIINKSVWGSTSENTMQNLTPSQQLLANAHLNVVNIIDVVTAKRWQYGGRNGFSCRCSPQT